jgi:hypothetical protein
MVKGQGQYTCKHTCHYVVVPLIETYRLMCLCGAFLSLPVAGRNQTDWVRHVRMWLLFYKAARDALYVMRVEGGCVT